MDPKLEINFNPKLVALKRRVVPCLPHWWIAGYQHEISTDEVIGIGFDRNKLMAKAKAKSECLERVIFRQWESSGVNPFTNVREEPLVSIGMAAHSDASVASEAAFNESMERICLMTVYSDGLRLIEVIEPPLPRLFSLAVRALGLELKLYVGKVKSHGYFCFAAIDLKRGRASYAADGFVFGSSFSKNLSQSSWAATLEASRKLAFIDIWKDKSKLSSPVGDFMKFWLSDAGRHQVQKFLAGSSPNSMLSEITIEVSTPKLLFTNNLWVSCCHPGNNKLPDPENLNIPLV